MVERKGKVDWIRFRFRFDTTSFVVFLTSSPLSFCPLTPLIRPIASVHSLLPTGYCSHLLFNTQSTAVA